MKITAPFTSQAPGMEERGKNSGEILWNYPSNPAHGKIDNSWGSLTAKTLQIKIWEERPPAWYQRRLIIFRTGFLAFFPGLQVRKKTPFCKHLHSIFKNWEVKKSFSTEMQFFYKEDICFGPPSPNQCCGSVTFCYGSESCFFRQWQTGCHISCQR